MTSLRSISVIIPTYQRAALVQRILRALANQTLAPDEYEVIVSIDGSDDETSGTIAQLKVPYRLIVGSQPHRGRAAACNAGIKLAHGELVVLLDDDMEPVPGFLSAHRDAHPAGSQLGVLGSVPITVDESSPPIVKYIGAKFNRHLEQLAKPGYQFELTHFYSGNFSICRDILLRIHAFDEAFKEYGNEDLDLSVRLRMAGVQLRFCSEARARQYYIKDFAALARDNIAKGSTAVLLATKHPQTFQDLKLATYRQGSGLWRLVRSVLLRISRLWPGTPNGVIVFITWLEKREPAHLHFFYRLALDYFYWLGAKSAMRHNDRTGLSVMSLLKSDKSSQS
jgi:glycosyltransferase involved in cell wall biosynthesis